jgi:hypothetical protein
MNPFRSDMLRIAQVCCLAAGAVTMASSAWPQAVTLADLQGATIRFSSVHNERLIRDGQERSVDLHTAGQVTIGPGNTVTSSVTSTSVSGRGSRTGSPGSGTFTLGKPGKTTGGDDVLWILSDNSLVRLRVYGGGSGGGQILRIGLRRGADGLHCTFSMPFAREKGAGAIRKGSAVDGVPIEILSWKPVSTSCQVSKQG